MRKFEKSDLKIIQDQAKYLDTIRKKLADNGKVILTLKKDHNEMDSIAQTLNGFRMYLLAWEQQLN